MKKLKEWINRKRNSKSFKEENVRVIKIGKEALFLFIYEKIIDEQEEFFDIKSADVTSTFEIDWERGEFIFCVYPCKDSNETIIQLPKEVDLRQLMRNIPNTTSSLYEENRYQEYTKEELVLLSKSTF